MLAAADDLVITPSSTYGMMGAFFCCSVLQCVAVRCSVLQCVAVRCSALQCVAVRCSALKCLALYCNVVVITPSSTHSMMGALCCSELQACCSVLQWGIHTTLIYLWQDGCIFVAVC